jgi:hypothetical protein
MERGASGGFLHLLPTVIPEGMTAHALAAAISPWLAPAFSGVVGTTSDDARPVLAVTFEWPLNWLRTPEALPTFEHEWLLLRRYSSDQALATGNPAFADVKPGSDPPDATVQTDAGQVGVESTALTIEGRREVHALFMQLRRRLQASEAAAFSKLAGHLIYVWFEAADEPLGKPHKRSDSVALDELVQSLAEYEPQGQQLWLPSGPLPQRAPALPLANTSAGVKFYAVPLMSAVPSSMLFTIAAFELGLAYTTFITDEAAWGELQRLVDGHDRPGVDLLLISAGGPDPNGNIFPAEEAVADFAVDHPLGLSRPPKHINTVVVHSWATGRATQLHPDIRPLFGPLYQGLVPLHHALAPPGQPRTTSADEAQGPEPPANDEAPSS